MTAPGRDSGLGALLLRRRAGNHAIWRRDPTPAGAKISLRWHVLVAVVLSFALHLGGLSAGLGLGVSLTLALLFFVVWGQVAASESWAFHEHGVRIRRFPGRARVTLVDDRSRIAYLLEGATVLQLDEVEFTSTRNADRAELMKLAVHYSRPVARRMLAKVRAGGTAHWLPGMALTPVGLFLTRGTRESRVTVPYPAITEVRVEDGVLHLSYSAPEPGSHRLDAGLPNLYPGRLALEVLRKERGPATPTV